MQENNENPNFNPTEVASPSSEEPTALTGVKIQSRITEVAVISLRVFFGNFIGFTLLSSVISLPFIGLYTAIYSSDVNLQTLFLAFGFFSVIRNNLLESAVILILPALLYRRGRISTGFFTYFIKTTAPKVIIWSLGISLLLVLAGIILPNLSFLLQLLVLFIAPALTLSNKGSNPPKIFKENLSLVFANPLLTIGSVLISNILHVIFIMLGALGVVLAVLNEAELNSLQALLVNESGQAQPASFSELQNNPAAIKLLYIFILTDIIFQPLKALVYGYFVMIIMKFFMPHKLAAFLKQYGLKDADYHETGSFGK